MLNITLLSLNILSQYSMSPLFMINFQDKKIFSSLYKSHFRCTFSTIVFSGTNQHTTLIENNIFLKTINTPLVFQQDFPYTGNCSEGSKCCISEDYNYQFGQIIKDQIIEPSKFPSKFTTKNAFFNDGCGNITISGCQFLNCYTNNDFGGGLLISEYAIIKIHNCIFNYCRSNRHGSGASISQSITVTYNKGVPSISYQQTNDIYIQYCCFSNCYSTAGNGFGSALMMSGKIIRLFYASTVYCPGKDHAKFRGAQFDMNSVNLSSQYVNATGSNSIYCGAMEYRDASTGFFQFQTVTKMNCKYAISFTSVDIKGLKITTSNIHNNTLNTVSTEDSNANLPALVFVQKKDLTLQDFYFYNNNFGTKGVYASKENEDHITITMINCYSNNPNKNLVNTLYVKEINCHFSDKILQTTDFDLLKLGSCKGEKNPGPLIITSFFTPSSSFSPSRVFTSSKGFTPSKAFSASNVFTSSRLFTPSNIFSDSGTFSGSNTFTGSNSFSNSKSFKPSQSFTGSSAFTRSNNFTKSNTFTPTGNFSNSHTFSPSSSFTYSDGFSQSTGFTRSNVFTSSDSFTASLEFTPSNNFTRSNTFTPTGNFSNSYTFSPSNSFTCSDEFSQSIQFTRSNDFTSSESFSASSVFTPSNNFTRSNTFTPTGNFSNSHTFSPSGQFTKSSEFTFSDEFTASNKFTSSRDFSATKTFTPSNNFTESNSFTESEFFTQSSQFTKSSPFTPTDNFTLSGTFSPSNNFTGTNTFIASKNFTSSNSFTPSEVFTSSLHFTSSRPFMNTNTFSASNVFSYTGNFTGSHPFVVIHIPTGGSSSGNDGKKIGIIVGISAGAAAAVGGIVAGIVLFAKKTNLADHEGTYIKMKKNDVPKTTENPLVDMMGENDDPFEDDFNLDDLDN